MLGRWIVLLLLFTVLTPVDAMDIYHWIDDHGNDVYGQTPPSDRKADKIKSRRVSTITSVPVSRPTAKEKPEKAKEEIPPEELANIIQPRYGREGARDRVRSAQCERAKQMLEQVGHPPERPNRRGQQVEPHEMPAREAQLKMLVDRYCSPRTQAGK